MKILAVEERFRWRNARGGSKISKLKDLEAKCPTEILVGKISTPEPWQ
jgi:hypothetical protein